MVRELGRANGHRALRAAVSGDPVTEDKGDRRCPVARKAP
jgi:hypothetical protein